MKKNINFILVLLFVAIYISCSKEQVSTSTQNVYQLKEVKSHTPFDLLKNSTESKYIDKDGRTKLFSIEIDRIEILKPFGETTYKTEEFDISYRLLQSNYYLNIKLFSNENSDGGISEFIASSLLTDFNNGLIPSVKINKSGDPVLCEIIASISLNGKPFENVYRNFSISTDGANSFEFIYYTKDMGIVGFHDEEGVLWVLEEYR